MRAFIAICAALVLVCLAAGNAGAQERRWGLTGLYGEIVASDCTDCGDDLGITLACQGERSNARVEIPFAAAQRFSEGPLPVTLTTDRGDSFTFEASLVEQGLVGFVPLFALPANHPLVEALSNASVLQVVAGDVTTTIGLAGSRQALTIFSAHCGWTQMPAYVADAGAASPSQSDSSDEARWTIDQAVARDGSERLRLTFGIPETDAILLSADCNAGQGTARLDVSVDFGGLADGASTDLQIVTRNGRFTYPGTVFIASEESAGVRVVVGGRAPLWRAMQAGGDVTFGVPGGAVSTLPAGDEEGVVASFVEACFVAVAAGAQPAVPAPVIVAPPVAPAPVAPIPSPMPAAPKPASPMPASPVPAADAPNPPAASAPVPVPPPAAPVSPPSGATGSGSYACPDGSSVTVAISGPATASVATVTVGSEAPLVLNGLPPTPSTVYSAGDAALVLKPSGIQLVQGAKLAECVPK